MRPRPGMSRRPRLAAEREARAVWAPCTSGVTLGDMSETSVRPLSPRVKCKALGVQVTPSTLPQFIQWLSQSLKDNARVVIVGHNLHSVYLHHTDEEFRQTYGTADAILADGFPVILDFKLSGGISPISRIGSTDWIPLLNTSIGVNRILLVGAGAVANQKAQEKLQSADSAFQVRGIAGDPWSTESESLLLDTIDSFRPDVVLLGMGMPLQEKVLSRIATRGDFGVFATVGGAIDQIAGVQRNAPRWMGNLGIEWLWRLATQPRRLWRRYLIEPWHLLGLRLLQEFRPKTEHTDQARDASR